jgi:basic membrane protein A and related proteins
MRRTRITTLATIVAATSLAVGGAVSAQSPDASTAATTWKIGVVTDIGTLNDKNFNEYTFKGAADGAAAIGAAVPDSFVPTDASEYLAGLQRFVDNGYNLIVTQGFNLAADTTQFAHDNPGIRFVGMDQSPICVDEEGNSDSTFACAGDAAALLPNYVSINFAEDQAGYLAGIVAATLSKSGKIGAIGGTSACAPCIRYIQGYAEGARSVNPGIEVNSKYVVSDFSASAFHDSTLGNTFAQQFLTQFPGTDVMFQVAGETGNGVLQAACAADILGIGVDVDQYLSLNAANDPAYDCLVTSAEKHIQDITAKTIEAIAAGTATGGDTAYNATNDAIGISDFHDKADLMTPDLQSKLDAAMAAMKAGTLKTCPDNCGKLE